MRTESLSSTLPDPYILVFREGEDFFWCSVNRKGERGRKNGPHTEQSVMEVAQAAAESLNDWEVRVEKG